MSVTEQKTIFEEMIEDVPASREKRKKISKAKHCVSREEWDEADAIYDEILAEFPEDEAALRGKMLLHRKRTRVESENLRREEKKNARLEKRAAREAKRRPRKARPIFHTKQFLVIAAIVFLLVGAAVAMILGIVAHRNSANELYGENAAVTDTCIILNQKTDVY
ncbi:MAG: hypothetical protein Q4A83_05695 [Bacillota bacterium]|nr:hypothetical protein [Bacillota bacterium]